MKSRPQVMGILNITPDSFSDGGKFLDPERALDQALQIEDEGADLIDIGAESTRPGADPVSVEEELRRLQPVLRTLVPRLRVPVSIDTRKALVARASIDLGAVLVNDISALSDPEMAKVVANAGVSVILMHMRGEPRTMQSIPIAYQDVVHEIVQFLRERIQVAEQAGIAHDKILTDPGLGFGKRPEDNWEIISRLREFESLEVPLVVGASRKSFIRQKYGVAPEQVMAGSIEVVLQAALNGASVVRVHDVRETCEALAGLETLAKRPPFL